MQYRIANKNDGTKISELSIKETGWCTNLEHLKYVLDSHPAIIALDGEDVCGFIYSQALSTDMLRICNFVVEDDRRDQGIGSELLERLEDQARKSGYKAILFPDDPEWFSDESLSWLQSQGYRDLFKTDKSTLVIKETEREQVRA